MTQLRGEYSQLLIMEDAEGSYGTDPSSAHCIKLPFETEGFQPNQTLVPQNRINQQSDAKKPFQGRATVEGPFVVPMDHEASGYWLRMLCGPPTLTTSYGHADLARHLFKVNSVTDSYVLEKGHIDGAAYLKVNGCKMASMQFRQGGEGGVMATANVVGKKETASGATMSDVTTTVTYTQFDQIDGGLKEGGSIISTVQELEFTVNRNLQMDGYFVKSGDCEYRQNLLNGPVNVTGRMTMMFENWSYYLYAANGTARELEVKWQTGSMYLQIDISELVYERSVAPVETPNGLFLALPFQAYLDAGSKSIFQADLVNTWSAYSGHIA